ncbi:MAG: hypothetical protein OEV87_03635 [Phycisphaerae bacterium]|nr:hypothetical protein [Phycisphaerae bacterium]
MARKKKKPKKKIIKKKYDSKSKYLEESRNNIPHQRKLCVCTKLIGKGILTLLAIWGAWVTLNPRVFVYPDIALDPNNPANTSFVIQNQGYLPIYDVTFSCSMKYLTLPGDIHVIAEEPYDNSFSDPKQTAKVIAPGKLYTILLPIIFMENNKIEESDIAIELTFRPIKWLPWQYETRHRFISIKGKDGQWHWVPQVIDK